VTQSPLAELESRFGRREAVFFPWFIGSIAALAVPCIVLVVGWMLELLIRASVAKSLPEAIQLGPRLLISTVWLDASQGPLRGVLALMGLAFGLAIVEAISLHALYRWAIHYALNSEIWLRRSLYEKNLALASQRGVVGQQAAQIEAVTHWIPQVRDGLLAWHRSVPRHLIQSIACFFLALLIHPILMVLAAIAFVLLWRIYGLIDGRRRRLRPLLTERIFTAKSRLSAMDESGPLFSSIHPESVARESFESSLRSLRDAEFRLYDCSLWKAPFLLATVALMLCLFSLALSVRILQENAELGVAGALCMLVLIALGYLSIQKVKRAFGPIQNANQASGRLLGLLKVPEPSAANQEEVLAIPLQHQLALENVTFADTLGQLLVKDVSFQAKPGMLVAIISTSGVEARAIGEMILGFGKPSAGRICWDDRDVAPFQPASLQIQCLSVAPDGPMISGTLLENLSNPTSQNSLADITDAIKLVGVYEAVEQLQDSLSTLISPGDDRLKNDALYQLGIARALLRKPSIVVAQEPADRVTSAIESRSVAALRLLTRQGSLVFVIPQRLSALRHADLVVLFHDHRVAATGTHSQLLEASELYRHLNYVRFSNLKDIAIS
jgi:ABC-type multidrug transport system fused ATPase/permease subunit